MSASFGPDNRPQIFMIPMIAVNYVLEQALNGRVEPELDATTAQIDAVTRK